MAPLLIKYSDNFDFTFSVVVPCDFTMKIDAICYCESFACVSTRYQFRKPKYEVKIILSSEVLTVISTVPYRYVTLSELVFCQR